MATNVVRVTRDGREFFLLGTAHVSRESVDEAVALIESEKPDRVCVEIDAGRYASMSDPDTWKRQDMVKVIRGGKGFLMLANLALASFQRRMGLDSGVKPGSEMIQAVETANRLGIPYSFCDREVQVTLKRAWAKGGFFRKMGMLASILASALGDEKPSPEEVEKLKDQGELGGMLEELATEMPTIKETLIDERDRYLASKIQHAEGKRVVAVVGAGHVPGIAKAIESPEGAERDVSALETVPAPGIGSKIAGWVFPVAILGLLAYGFYLGGAGKSLDMLLQWVLWNGSLAALGAALCLAHPLTILAAFPFAPIATLNPLLGVGMFTGAIEAMLRKPSVADFERLQEDIGSLKSVYRNRVTRALLIFLLSTIGGAIGNIIAIPSLIGKLF